MLIGRLSSRRTEARGSSFHIVDMEAHVEVIRPKGFAQNGMRHRRPVPLNIFHLIFTAIGTSFIPFS